MSEYRIDFRDRFQSVFKFAINTATPSVADVGLAGGLFYGDLETYEGEEAVARAKTGAPIFDVLELSHPDLPGDLHNYVFELPPLFEFSRTKLINTTIINEDQQAGLPSSEVIESFGWRPWEFVVRGLLIDQDNHQFPYDQLEALNQLTDIHDTIEASSRLLNACGISTVYIVYKDLIPSEFYNDQIGYVLRMKSHVPAEDLINV